ncbi:MAG TPA: AMP-binding protein [Actinophytocola sp.]|uniref:AMP-binding protein n=1 Tax=Actinophytocola sp. TaxID=1872138 RepID=UPI002DB70DA0|nr:AMP-binding protein [Actinophytocola sp.]HEU5473810.1 AMP-binding protein [Actinophytocola sp.]
MSTELVEVVTVIAHTPAEVWQVVGDPGLYPRFVREVTWAERTGQGPMASGARYRMRFSLNGANTGHDEIEVLVYRPAEHLVLVSPRWQGGHFSIRLGNVHHGRTEVQVTLSVPDRVTGALGLSASWLRKQIREALAMIDHHLAGRALTVTRTGLDQTATEHSSLTVARTLIRAGVVRPGRPDRVIRQINALARWGATVAGGYLANARRHPDQLAVIDERRSLTFAELDRRATRLANGLAELGVRAGRRVALMCRNHAGFIESVVACGKLGADVVLLNTGLSSDQVASVITAHRPVALLGDEEFLPLFHGLPTSLPWVTTWSDRPGEGGIDTLIERSSSRPLRPPPLASKIIVLTSGTTGAPKGAKRRNPRGIGTAAAMLDRIPLRAGERTLVAAPLFHTWGLAALQLGMVLHATLVLQRRFEPVTALRAIDRKRCTSMFAVPIMLQRILDLPEDVRRRFRISTLRVVASSGSALPGPFVTEFLNTFGDVLYNLYGSTEVSWASIAGPADLRAAPTTAGRCPLGTRVGILDATGRPVPPGVVGRICVGNDMLFEGYTNGTTGEVHDQMMVTGDIGYLDADGRLFVSGRDDDMIVSGGENVFPRPLEELLLTLPGVLDVAVVGVPDREFGERFAAYIALRPGSRLDAATVRGYVHDHMPRFAVPRDVIFLDDLPRNATGKVVKRMLSGEL